MRTLFEKSGACGRRPYRVVDDLDAAAALGEAVAYLAAQTPMASETLGDIVGLMSPFITNDTFALVARRGRIVGVAFWDERLRGVLVHMETSGAARALRDHLRFRAGETSVRASYWRGGRQRTASLRHPRTRQLAA